jgi:cytochrome c5
MRGTPTILVIAALAALLSACAREPAKQQEQAEGLAAGAGRELVEASCTSCHNARVITNSSGYTRAHWNELIATMVELAPEAENPILDYLAEHYPPSHN